MELKLIYKIFNQDLRLNWALYVNDLEIVTAAWAIVTTTPVITTDLTTTWNTLLWNWAWDTCAVSWTLAVTWLITATAWITWKIIMPSTQIIAAWWTTSAIDLTKFHHDIDADAWWDIFTVATWTIGQVLLIVLKTATWIATITPATFLWGTSITLNAVWDSVMLYYWALGWQIMWWNSYAIV